MTRSFFIYFSLQFFGFDLALEWLSARTLALLLGVVASTLAFSVFTDFYRRSIEMPFEDFTGLQEEIKKLETSVAASEAALKVEEPGPYARLRRIQAQSP